MNIDPVQVFKDAAPLLISAYMGIWLGVLIYVLILQGKIRGLRKQIEVLNKAIEKKSAEKEPETINV